MILLYKIINKIAPSCLFTILVDSQFLKNNENLRSKNSLVIPFCRTNKYKTSFFPSTCKMWNELDECVANCSTLNSFKSSVLMHCNCNLPSSSFFNSLYGFYAQTLTQIRLGLSNLRGQLFSYCICENPFCPLCLHAPENPIHFFLECPALLPQRTSLLSNLKLLVPNLTVFSKLELLNLCLSGRKDFNNALNIAVLKQSIFFHQIIRSIYWSILYPCMILNLSSFYKSLTFMLTL